MLAAEAALKERERDDRDDEIAWLKGKVGEMTMETELLREKIAAFRPAPLWHAGGRGHEPSGLALRRSRLWPGAGRPLLECFAGDRVSPPAGTDCDQRRPGPVGPCDDATLLEHIRKAIAESRFTGEGDQAA